MFILVMDDGTVLKTKTMKSMIVAFMHGIIKSNVIKLRKYQVWIRMRRRSSHLRKLN